MLDSPTTNAAALVSVVAQNIKNFRTKRGLSLSELATKAGIGKSTLSLLESGRANPSIETLWAIGAALGVPFGQLIEPHAPDVRIVRAGEGTRVESQDARFGARLLTSSHRRGTFELYVLEAEPGTAREAAAHIRGTVEHVFVLAGRLRVGPIDAPVEIAAGDLASFAGDVAHAYEALTEGTQALLVMDHE